MKTLILIVILLSGLMSCKNDNITSIDNTSILNTSLEIKDVLPPSINSVTGGKGYNTSNAANSFGTYFIAELNGGSSITINGSNFGNIKGSSSLFFERSSGNIWSTAPNYTLTVTSWTNNRIVVNLKTNTNSIPFQIARFRIVTSGGTGSIQLSVVPYIWTRQYHQCTWWATKRSIENGIAGFNSFYSNVNKTINANYIPTAKDLLSWGTSPASGYHTAYIESVNVSTESGNVTRFDIRISEANVPLSSNGNTTGPVYYTTTVKIKYTNGVKSFVSGFNKYRSTLTAGASFYKDQ